MSREKLASELVRLSKAIMDSKLKKKRYDQRASEGNGKVHLRITMAHTLPNT